MKKSYNDDIEILIDTLKTNIKVFEIIKESNKNEKEQIKYLICVTQELKKLCETVLPSLKSYA